MYEIIMYSTESGKIPVKEYLNSLEPKLRTKTTKMIALLGELGYTLREPYSKCLGNKIFELRTQQGSNITRILFFFVIGNKIVLTNGFTKKSQKTPVAEIELAQRYKLDYERRYCNV